MATSRLGALWTSRSAEWYTPAEVLDRVAACLGGIDLDPAADPGRRVPAARHYTAAEDGLRRPWDAARVFCNPPYGRDIRAWVLKAVSEYRLGRAGQALLLVPARTDTAWWRLLDPFPVAFWRGRIRFETPDGLGDAAPFPSAVAALGVAADRLAAAFDGAAVVRVPFPG